MGDIIRSRAVNLLREVDRFGPILQEISDHISQVLSDDLENTTSPESDEGLKELAQSIYQARRKRSEFIPIEMLGEPAWDMMLDLFVHHGSKKQISVSSATIASAVPPTTGLRWVTLLEQRKWVERYDDPMDRRRSFLKLTDCGYSIMVNCLRSYIAAF